MIILIYGNFYWLLLAFFLFGFGHMLQVNSSQAILGDLVPRELRGKAVGCTQFFLYLGQALAFLLVGFLYSYVSPQLPFVLLALLSVPLAIYVWLKVFEPVVREV
jgi:MFS family permease